MILSMRTENNIKDLKNSEDTFDFSNLDENHELFSNKIKKVFGKFEIETPINIWIDEVVCLRSKVFSFKCKNEDESKIRKEGFSKSLSKHNKIEEDKKCLDGKNFRSECDIYFFRSINQEMFLHKKRKSLSSIYDDKQFCLNEIEIEPWN